MVVYAIYDRLFDLHSSNVYFDRYKTKMEDDSGKTVELYIPRKCSASSRLIAANDHASIQIDFVDVDPETGRMIPGKVNRYAICGEIRRMGESDDALVRLAQKDGIIPRNL